MLDWISNKSGKPKDYTLFDRFLDMLNKDDYPMVISDDTGSFIYANDSALELYGYTERSVNNDISVFINESACLKYIRSRRRYFKDTLEDKFTVVDYKADGSKINIDAHSYIINLSDKYYIFSIIGNERMHRSKDLLLYKPIKDRNIIVKVVETAMAMADLRDPGSSGYQRKVADLSTLIAEEIGLPPDQNFRLHIASLLHDIGKLCVPLEILKKSGKLDDNEFNLIKKHCETGYGILTRIGIPEAICKIILQHHERLDGTGYPNGLCSEDISIESKILGVADVVNAMISHRPHRPGLGVEEAIDEINSKRNILYDSNVVDACIKILTKENYEFSDEVKVEVPKNKMGLRVLSNKSHKYKKTI